jgi:hypothetical protein
MNPSSAPMHSPANNLRDILTDIKLLETRLEQMGFDGDSAYEKRLIAQYHDLISVRRKSLSKFLSDQRHIDLYLYSSV